MKRSVDLSGGLIASKEPELVRAGPAKILSVSGEGAPESGAFQAAIQALYGLVWTLKMTKKPRVRGTFKVPPLEGFWWGAPGREGFARTPRSHWHWKLFLRVPSWITAAEVRGAAKALEERGRGDGARKAKLEVLDEGVCVQALHVGPYASEPETIRRMEEFAHAHGLTFVGKHHEIYLGDPRRAKPQKLRTTLRHAVRAY